jgi:chromosome segregation ATPase
VADLDRARRDAEILLEKARAGLAADVARAALLGLGEEVARLREELEEEKRRDANAEKVRLATLESLERQRDEYKAAAEAEAQFVNELNAERKDLLAVAAERDALRGEADGLERFLDELESAAYAALERRGRKMPFGSNYGEAALELPRLLALAEAERDALRRVAAAARTFLADLEQHHCGPASVWPCVQHAALRAALDAAGPKGD